ncbi:MAG: hypothetical protein M1821_003665 [Bathelium mastoideum]|nr:MAG: hypothetical protein M1821_003665 [Bathelium mastoideum]KAI9684954.1 MAG: hypothetical protein M1822_005603 [Bathelium mastoideum]
MAFPSSRKTRFMIISDTHTCNPAAHDDPDASQYGFVEPLPEVDVLLHCGDLTMVGLLPEYERVISMLGSIKAQLKLVIAGNHDCSLDKEYYRRAGRYQHGPDYDTEVPKRAMEMWKGDLAKRAGITYLEEGTYEFTLKSGATFTIYASPYQPEFCNWAFPYKKHEDRFNPPQWSLKDAHNIAQNPIEGYLDIVMTHGPAFNYLDRQFRGMNVGCPHLTRALMRTRPLLHCCGHIHEAHGAEKISWEQDAAETATREMTIQQWKSARLSSRDAAKVETGFASDKDARNPIFIDYSSSGRPLKRNEETLLINAAIVDLEYRPVYAPYIVDLDLRTRE